MRELKFGSCLRNAPSRILLAKFALFLFLGACNTSPYTAAGIPSLKEINYVWLDDKRAELTFTDRARPECEANRDALMLKSAYLALSRGFDHFSMPDNIEFRSSLKSSRKPIIIDFCRGACPGMYSADALSHVLVNKFSGATFPSGGNKTATIYRCEEELKTMQNYIIDIAPR